MDFTARLNLALSLLSIDFATGTRRAREADLVDESHGIRVDMGPAGPSPVAAVTGIGLQEAELGPNGGGSDSVVVNMTTIPALDGSANALTSARIVALWNFGTSGAVHVEANTAGTPWNAPFTGVGGKVVGASDDGLERPSGEVWVNWAGFAIAAGEELLITNQGAEDATVRVIVLQ